MGRYTAQKYTTLHWGDIDYLKELEQNKNAEDLKDFEQEEIAEELRDYVQEQIDEAFREVNVYNEETNKYILQELRKLGTPDLNPIADDIWSSFIIGFDGEWYRELHKNGVYPWGKDYDLLKDCQF